jgi:hypothetical protein
MTIDGDDDDDDVSNSIFEQGARGNLCDSYSSAEIIVPKPQSPTATTCRPQQNRAPLYIRTTVAIRAACVAIMQQLCILSEF